MKIEIKNVKYSAFASQETHCFEATVYVDGKKEFGVSNDGHGGCDMHYSVKGGVSHVNSRVSEINAILNKETINLGESEGREFNNPDGSPMTIKNDLDIVIGGLMNEWHREKEVKKVLKRISYVKPSTPRGSVFQLPAKYKPTINALKRVKEAGWWKNDYVLLNDLTPAEVIKYL